MKIVHIITRLIVGGAQENTLLSCEGQHALGHEVTLITGPPAGPEGSLLERAQASGYRMEIDANLIRAVRPAVDYRAYRGLVQRLRELHPDIVHTHSSKAGIIGRWAAHQANKRGAKAKIIHTIHGLAFTASTRKSVNAAYRWLERRAAPITDRIVCVATDMAAQSLAAGIGRPEQYVTVYSGMDTQPFLSPPVPRDEVRQSLGIAAGDVVVGTIARLFHMKGHDDLLALAPALCRAHPHLKFLWLGDGLLRPQFERQIAEMNLQNRFILTGLVPPTRIPELVNAMDILVHPSRREGLARALPQGQLAGCPVVTYDIDGNREGLIDGQTGYLVSPFDRTILAQRLSALLSGPQQAREMGAAGRAFARERFDTSAMVSGLERVYQEVVQ
ncbi:MAG TPA: glycosyltransferase family 4 protein [Tepidisphaeraceae bacterium]|jgi:glycosyltransferase involved in cell wall biosynthesis